MKALPSHNCILYSLVSIFLLLTICQIVALQQQEIYAENQNNVSSNNITDIEAFNPTKKIKIVLEDTEIEIAPGKKIKTWAFNGTGPGPPLRFTEGENVSILFVNKGLYPHTMHFHGIHDDKNDGASPFIMPGKSYTYNLTAEPAGALMYHCHVPPVSEHIRMGMYGALIIDPKDKPLKPAKEYYMVSSEFST